MPQVIEEVLVLYSIGRAERPSLVWGKGEVPEVEQIWKDSGVDFIGLIYDKTGSIFACHFETELLRTEEEYQIHSPLSDGMWRKCSIDTMATSRRAWIGPLWHLSLRAS